MPESKKKLSTNGEQTPLLERATVIVINGKKFDEFKLRPDDKIEARIDYKIKVRGK